VDKFLRDIAKILVKKKQTLSVCESCTGGMLGEIITRVPGSSKYFLGGMIAYSDVIKKRLVGIKPGLLKKSGAVSPEVARAMAQGVRRVFKSDIGMGITGIAGPSGGSKKKPVGLVYISLSFKRSVLIKKLELAGGRDQIRKRACKEALSLLRSSIQVR
jgi:nicotinamide-nucleotide amidase